MKFNLLRFSNTIILVAFLVLTLTGVYGLFWAWPGWVFELHRIASWFLIVMIPWKLAISWRSLRRGLKPNLDRGVLVALSALLGAVTLLVIALGLLWAFRLGPEQYWLRQTAISWHWMLSLGLVLPFLLHAWRRWPRPRKVDLISRRAALKLLGVSAAALSAWWLSEILAGLRNLAEVPERLTGSRRQGYLSGNHFPITHTKAASKERTDPAIWRLMLVGALKEPLEFTYQQLLAHPLVEKEVILDCTLGWYTVQRWRGIPLQTLFEQAGISARAVAVQLKSVTGYARSLPMREARGVLLATHVGDEELDYAHGYPIRAVVPSRRGWYWVKWLGRIEVL
jgi:hypothetical protein